MSQQLNDDVVEARARAMDSARPEAVSAIHGCGKLTARERVAAVVDDGSTFMEFGVLADGHPDAPGDAPADGVVGGVGQVSGSPVVFASYDTSVHRGTQSETSIRKVRKLIYLAIEHRWPFVCFAAGEGRRTNESVEPYKKGAADPGAHGILDGLAELSGWAPTIAVLGGRAVGGNAALALMCDLVVATRSSSLGGTGQFGLDDIEFHAQIGDVDVLADDDFAAADAVRNLLSYWLYDARNGSPAAAASEIGTVVPDGRRPYDMRKLILRFADADSVLELRPSWGRSLITAFARLEGRAIGIFANQPLSATGGAIDADAADKISRFVEMCDCYGLPLVSFIDNPGYMVGPHAERAGIARHHARPLSALHHRRVQLYSVQVRKAYGLGPSAMSGYGESRLVPELRLAWPTAEAGGMSLEGAATFVRRKEIQAAQSYEEVRRIQTEYADSARALNSGLRAGMKYHFDDVILPEETRGRIAGMLRVSPRARASVKLHYIDAI